MRELPRFLLHFLNSEILKIYRGSASTETVFVLRFARLLTRYALVLSDKPVVVLPAALFEREFANRFLEWLLPASRSGLVEYASPTQDLEQYAVKKQREYRDSESLFRHYVMTHPVIESRNLEFLQWLPRLKKSASGQIANEWHDELLLSTGLVRQMIATRASTFQSTKNLERMLFGLPQALDGRAFITDNVIPFLPKDITSRELTGTSLLLSRAYLRSFLDEYSAAAIIETPLGRLDCGVPVHDIDGRQQLYSFRRAQDLFSAVGLSQFVNSTAPLGQLLALRVEPSFQWLRDLIVGDLTVDNTGHSDRRLSWALAAAKYVPQKDDRPTTVRDVINRLHILFERLAKYVEADQAIFPEMLPVSSKSLAGLAGTTPKQISLWGSVVHNGNREEKLRVRARIGVITALPKEFAAVKAMLENPLDWAAAGSGSGRRYVFGEIPALSGGTHSVALALMTDMGNNNAAVRASQLQIHCPSVEHLIMCGIAGGIPRPTALDRFAHLGDVVISDEFGVIQYDFVKESSDSIEVRARPRPSGAELLEAVKYLKVDEIQGIRRWERYLERGAQLVNGRRPPDDLDASGQPIIYPLDESRIPGMPRVFVGPIASANILLKDSRRRDILAQQFNVQAIEMESSGIADAAWISGRAGYLTVRGICDYCDPAKGDVWQGYAAVSAAACVRAVIEKIVAVANEP